MRIGVNSMVGAAVFSVFLGSAAAADELSKPALERVYSVGKSFAIAQQIAKQCRSFRLRNGTKRTVERYLLDIGQKEGVDNRGMKQAFRSIPAARIQDDMLGYVAKRGIVIAERTSWCKAGQAEMAAGGQIANFLVAK